MVDRAALGESRGRSCARSCAGRDHSIVNESLTALAGCRERPMPTYKAPVDDTLFLLNDVLHLDRYGNLPGFSDASPDVVEAVLREAAKFSEEVLTPLNRVGDKEGCRRDRKSTRLNSSHLGI